MTRISPIWIAALYFINAVSVAYGSDTPPGCAPENQGIIGGCSGKAQIEDMRFIGPDCILVTAGNCNGGVIEIYNSCGKDLKLGNLIIAPLSNDKGAATSVELEKDTSGKVTIKESRGNYASYTPKETEELAITGDLEGQEVKLSYTKTKQLCE